jgi:nitrite reductase (NO-forming)
VIGEIFDKVYTLGGVELPPVTGIQTVAVPAGGAVITEFKTHIPGNYTLVDHALARAERGRWAFLTSREHPTRTSTMAMPGMGHEIGSAIRSSTGEKSTLC